nr:CCC motif membrane protein [uncultured Psychroserpens sp.]
MSYNKLPADPTALILGIVAIVIGFAGCCCYGIFAIVPLAVSIIGLVMANKSLKEFALHPEAFSPQSRSNVSTAKVLNIIAIVFNGVIVLMFIAAIVFYGIMPSQGFYDDILRQNNDDDFHYEWESDTIFDYEDDDYNRIESDTISIDSIRIDDGEIIEVEKPLGSLNE